MCLDRKTGREAESTFLVQYSLGAQPLPDLRGKVESSAALRTPRSQFETFTRNAR
jgi:hypothetical protein